MGRGGLECLGSAEALPKGADTVAYPAPPCRDTSDKKEARERISNSRPAVTKKCLWGCVL